MIRFRSRRGAGRRTGARLVGEQAALHAVHHHRADAAAHDLAHAERLGEDAAKDRRQRRDVGEDDDDGHQEVQARHDRHNDVEHLDRRVPAQDDDRRDRHQRDGGVERVDAEGALDGAGDGVADDLADAAPADEAGEREQRRDDGLPAHPVAELTLHKRMDVVRRAAAEAAVERVFLLIQLGKRRLDVGRRSADQRHHPHPEPSARAAGGDPRDDAAQVAHAHARGGGDDQGLHAGDRLAVLLALFKRDAHHLRQHAQAHEARAQGEVNARGHQKQNDQRKAQAAAARQRNGDEIAPHELINRLDQADYKAQHILKNRHRILLLRPG